MIAAEPARAWTPPLEAEGLAHVIACLRSWEAFDGEVLLDEVADVVDDAVPDEADVHGLAELLRGHLMRLVNIAVANEAEERDETAARLIERARALRVEELPGGHWNAVGHLRRAGWIASDLLERMVEIRCVKSPDPAGGGGRSW
ncbi:DUF6415 family natural product biosynthesis protein [Streptomyces sp. NPDC058434]|uniref:DUF6415 family natural product biosynthesis protein n=1 Tax=Streptomyces sp. NPDC058434 TaxID=3346498 RepID=UPI00365C9C81